MVKRDEVRLGPEEEVLRGMPGASIYRFDSREFPWWLVVMVALIIVMAVAVVLNSEYREAFENVFPLPLRVAQGITLTMYLTVGSFVVATLLGLFIGLARVSERPVVSNLAALYIEFIRGIPMLVFIFAVALVLAPDFASLVGMESRAIPQAVRGAAALSLFYAAFSESIHF